MGSEPACLRASRPDGDEGAGFYDPGAKPAARAAPLHTVKSFVGTVTYMSPERIAGGEYGTPADVWSLGLSFWAVALGSLPVRETDGYWSLLQSIRDEPPPRLPADDARWSPAFRGFLEACLAKDPEKRPPAAALCEAGFCAEAALPAAPAPAAPDVPDDLRRRLKRRAVEELLTTLRASAAHLRHPCWRV